MRNDVLRVWSGKLPKEEPKKTTAQIAQEVIDGKWGNGEERVERLKAAGYEEVRLVDTTEEIFGSKSRAKMLALGASAALVGRK